MVDARARKMRRVFALIVLVAMSLGFIGTNSDIYESIKSSLPQEITSIFEENKTSEKQKTAAENGENRVGSGDDKNTAIENLNKLVVKGRAPKAGYSRKEFGDGWRTDSGGCDTRNIILARDLTDETYVSGTCKIGSGKLKDPYTGKDVYFQKGDQTSQLVQIDHVVALSDSWQKGAQQLDYETRVNLANDPLNLLAVDGQANQNKSDSDAASWLPEYKPFRCQYVERQIAVKIKYNLWVTQAEKDAMNKVLTSSC